MLTTLLITLYLSDSTKKLSRLVNADLKYLVNWLDTKKISLSFKKTEILIFKSKQNKLKGVFFFKLCCKRIYPAESVTDLGVKTDTNLSWQYHVHVLSIKLN